MKNFWNIFKKVIFATFGLAMMAGLVILLVAAHKHQKQIVCSSIQVEIDYESGLSFVTVDEIKSKINYLSGGNIVGKPLSAIDFKTIEKELEKNPYIQKAALFTNQQNEIIASLTQKTPLLRVINNDGVSYYLSEDKEKMPVCANFTARVPLANGVVEIKEDQYGDSVVLNQLCLLTKFITKDTVLNAMIDQVEVLENGEFDLHPKFGYHRIHFGKVDEKMDSRFDKLKTFYQEVLTRVGWEKYKAINLKFDNQIVAEQRDTIR